LWTSDGTTTGTLMLKDIQLGAGDSSPANLTAVDGTLYFTANDGIHGIELWTSDGTASGTVLVKDIYPGAPDASPSGLANVNGTLLFSANDGATGRELWKSRSTTATTAQVQNIAAGAGDSDPASFTTAGTKVFFSANDDTAGDELWAIPIAALNYAPSASNLTVGTSLNTPVSGTLPATDPEGSPLTFSIVTNGTKGVVSITNATTGAFTYMPNAGASGGDSFSFKVSDGQADSNVAIVNITIGGSAIYLPLIRR
ncbi:MAG TPA: ELWxxDGT repeat protein, partial [Roseiflexaceae bacterium]